MADMKQTDEWELYEAGKDYNRQLSPDLYSTVDKNERFYAGDQWKGVVANGLPTPVFNIFKRVINYFVAFILSQPAKITVSPRNIGDNEAEGQDNGMAEYARMVSGYFETLWEQQKMNYKMRTLVRKAALSGDMGEYFYWDPSVFTGQDAQGDIAGEVVDGVNIFFGNPNCKDPQRQPYILISGRELVKNLKEEAKRNGISSLDIDKIAGDTDNQEQAGDRGKNELGEKTDFVKTTFIVKLWKGEDGYLRVKKSTRYTPIRKEYSTKQRLYPVAWENWEERDNSYHGQAVGTGLIPNQVFINKLFAMAMISIMVTAFPKAIYNKNMISAWNNQVGAAIGVDGPIDNVATYLTVGQMAGQVAQFIDLAIKYTKDMLGASDAAMGDIKPDNTSAIIAVQKAAAIPLDNPKANVYSFVEQIGYIWLDMINAYYIVPRMIAVKGKQGGKEVKEFLGNQYDWRMFALKVDEGPSTYWSELTAITTLDNLLRDGYIQFIDYLERVPEGYIPQKQQLIDKLKMQQQQLQQQQATVDPKAFIASLPPEVQLQLMALPEEEAAAMVQQMMAEQMQNNLMPGGAV